MSPRRICLCVLLGTNIAVANAERLCNEYLYVDASEREVSTQYRGMTEEAIYSLIVKPSEFDGQAVTTAGLLTKLDTKFFLVPPNSPDAKYSPVTRVEIVPKSEAHCFLEMATNYLVLARGKFRVESRSLLLTDVYHVSRLMKDDS